MAFAFTLEYIFQHPFVFLKGRIHLEFYNKIEGNCLFRHLFFYRGFRQTFLDRNSLTSFSLTTKLKHSCLRFLHKNKCLNQRISSLYTKKKLKSVIFMPQGTSPPYPTSFCWTWPSPGNVPSSRNWPKVKPSKLV